MGKFNKIKIGDRAELKHIITQKDVERFVELTGDDNKIHVDKNYAEKSPFKKPIVHGMLSASFISTVIGTKLPGDGALWFAQNLEFLHPVKVNDEILIKAEVIKKIDSLKVIELKTDIYNRDKEKVTTGTARVRIIEEEAPHKIKGKKDTKRVALVIGGAGGIGSATSLQLASDGFDVAVHYLENRKEAEKVKKEIEKCKRKSTIVKADITNNGEVKEMTESVVRNLGTVTVLVNCATARLPNIKFASLSWEDIQKHLDVNIKGFFNLARNVAPIMERNNYGKIINITTQAIETPNAGWLHYITAKSGLNGFSKALAMELAPKGIRVNMVSPGMTDTELISNIPEKTKLLAAAKTPLKRIAEPEDVAGAISFLASEKSDFLTGETIRVNGGQIML